MSRAATTRDADEGPAALSVSGLAFAYPDGRQALFGVDLEVEPGERVAVLGPNGAGKTTLLLHLVGVLGAVAGGTGAGRIRVGGLELSAATLARVRRRVGLVFQDADDQLFILVVDADMDLHVLQYDPENPKSLSGTRLLHRSTFHLGHFPTTMTLVPSTLSPFAEQQPLAEPANGDSSTPAPQQQHQPLFHVLITTQTGSIGLVTPVDESTYRRLGAVEAHLTSILEHAAGLNPREFRAVDSEGFGARGVVDGGLVQRISELGSTRRAEVLGRAGGDAWVLRSDLEILGGGGLGWL